MHEFSHSINFNHLLQPSPTHSLWLQSISVNFDQSNGKTEPRSGVLTPLRYILFHMVKHQKRWKRNCVHMHMQTRIQFLFNRIRLCASQKLWLPQCIWSIRCMHLGNIIMYVWLFMWCIELVNKSASERERESIAGRAYIVYHKIWFGSVFVATSVVDGVFVVSDAHSTLPLLFLLFHSRSRFCSLDVSFSIFLARCESTM